MHTDANASPNASTGPITESGKARSSRNALKSGLFSATDFVRDSEADEYTQTFTALLSQLTPEGVLEQLFSTEIMTATWRLRRCLILEKDAIDFSNEQKSIDRARAQSHGILRRSMAELRKLQTERTIREQLESLDIPGLTDTKQVLTTLVINGKQRLDSRKSDGTDSLEGLMAKADKDLGMQSPSPGSSFCNPPEPPPDSSFCKPPEPVSEPASSFCEDSSFCKNEDCEEISASVTAFYKSAPATPQGAKSTPRNATCPCGSGTKYKRCCGTGAPPVLNMAA